MKKILMNFCIVIVMLFVSIVPTFATDIKNTGTTNVPVTAIVNSSFTVTIPKSIDISNENASYNIGVSGDLAGNEKLTVVPTQAFEMKEKNNFKQPVTATVTQDKKEWSYTDVAASIGASGSIVANLSAGDWSGTLAFNVSISQVVMDQSITIFLYHGNMENEPDGEGVQLPNKMSIKEWIDMAPNYGTASSNSVIDSDGCKLYKYLENNQYEEIKDTSVMLEENAKYVFK